ncbi:MAG: ubiquitin-conjugating enzyme E2 [Holophagales bacterium]|nr:ubiquitin-conjugating enzyme E2 [Holophagales bacterium]MYD21746.1 ubiquitin-conjugating enzyme E2 [Holophagales bacterium]MYI32057.1 ubiquitin-conjugating enzyme E2 [Holophagales bacterium]
MNLPRVRQEIAAAQHYFDYVEGHPTVEGGVMALIALETSRSVYTMAVRFPESYPNGMPEVHVRTPPLESSPHRYAGSQICYLHPSMWNPGRHDLTFVIQRAAKWLAKYEVFRQTGRWPGAGIAH